MGAIGDIVHCLCVANILRKNFPNAQIDWVVDEKCEKLLIDNPLIDNVLSVPLSKWKQNWFKSWGKIKEFNKKLAKNQYDWAFDLHGMFKSLVIFAFCKAKKRVGYSDYKEFAPLGANVLVKPKTKRKQTHIMRRNIDLILNCGLINNAEQEIDAKLPPAKQEVVQKVNDLLLNIDKSKKTIVFAPATTWKSKHWDVGQWQKLFDLTKNDYNIIFTGTKSNLDLINKITRGDKNALILAGKTNLEEYIEILRRPDWVISPDSSAAHIAWAHKKPRVITIFTSTSKDVFAPPRQIAFPQNACCKPCFKRNCNSLKCTKQTSALEVFTKLTKD